MGRLLCLHGACSSSDVTRLQLTSLGLDALGLELVCVDAPLESQTSIDGSGRGRTWQQVDGAPASADELAKQLEDSLRFVVKHVRDHGPYDGAFGFSQGAAVVTLLSDASLRRSLGCDQPLWECATAQPQPPSCLRPCSRRFGALRSQFCGPGVRGRLPGGAAPERRRRGTADAAIVARPGRGRRLSGAGRGARRQVRAAARAAACARARASADARRRGARAAARGGRVRLEPQPRARRQRAGPLDGQRPGAARAGRTGRPLLSELVVGGGAATPQAHSTLRTALSIY
eukprot:Transcript_22744.p1 GENE.Transcript_22744~~Transcript_22744.p1  ORF type:complete len:288 (+),score=19.60 Transcript_22744:81-944(+)